MQFIKMFEMQFIRKFTTQSVPGNKIINLAKPLEFQSSKLGLPSLESVDTTDL
jgi:hypothetical protein